MYAGSDRRRPSQDTTLGRRPSESASVTSDAQSATAGMGMIIPNKSTIAEEEIEVPYGRDSQATARYWHYSTTFMIATRLLVN